MALERWGSLSTTDHVDTAALVANVLLYDRLVFPVMDPDQPDRDEALVWKQRGWNPALQQERIEALGPLAVPRRWTYELRQRLRSRVEWLAAEQHEANLALIDPMATREVLAQDLPPLPAGVHHALLIPAYNSLQGLQIDAGLSEADDAPPAGQLQQQMMLITRRLPVIDLAEPEQSLSLAVDLSKDATFRGHRQALFDWAQLKTAQGYGAMNVVDELRDLTEAYNAAVQKATKKVYWKYAFMVLAGGGGFAFGGLPGATAAASIAVARFWMFDRKPDAVNDASRPAAMFHDIEQRIGLKLKP